MYICLGLGRLDKYHFHLDFDQIMCLCVYQLLPIVAISQAKSPLLDKRPYLEGT